MVSYETPSTCESSNVSDSFSLSWVNLKYRNMILNRKEHGFPNNRILFNVWLAGKHSLAQYRYEDDALYSLEY